MTGNDLGQAVLNELEYLGLHNRGTKSKTGRYGIDYYGIIRNSKDFGFPAIIVEHAFIDIPSEREKYLTTDASLKELGIADATGIAAYYGLKRFSIDKNGRIVDLDGKAVKSKWVRVNGKYYYTDSEGLPLKGFQKIGSAKFYLGSGAASKGWFNKDGNRYYRFNDKGQLMKGTVSKIGNYKYGFDKDGAMYNGTTAVIKDKKYIFAEGGKAIVYKGKTKKKVTTYEGAGTKYKKAGKIKKNAAIRVTRTTSKWSRLEDGRWIQTKYVKGISKYPKYVAYKVVTSKNTAYRKGPGTSYKKKGTYGKGKTLTIVSWKNGWGKMKNGYWIYLKNTKRAV